MSKLLDWVEKHLGKMITIPIAVSSIEFILTLCHMLDDGVISHDELNAVIQTGNGSNMIMLALALAYLKFKK